MKFEFKYAVLFCAFIVAIYFLYTFNRVYDQSKEVNCITYYTSLGYKANGCDKYIERFIGDFDE